MLEWLRKKRVCPFADCAQPIKMLLPRSIFRDSKANSVKDNGFSDDTGASAGLITTKSNKKKPSANDTDDAGVQELMRYHEEIHEDLMKIVEQALDLEECEIRHAKEFVDERKRIDKEKNDADGAEIKKDDKVSHDIFKVISSTSTKRTIQM